MGSGSRCLCGFPDLRVEMGLARVRALTLFALGVSKPHVLAVEMGLARVRALTHNVNYITVIFCNVEMGLARVRALTPEFIQVFCCIFYDVEMGLARVRALTPSGFGCSCSFL